MPVYSWLSPGVIADEGFKSAPSPRVPGVRAMRRVKRLDEGLRLRIESEDDLWVLSQVCGTGCLVGMLSHRRDSTTGTKEDGRAKSAERKPMWIVLESSETAFQPFTDNLRVHGVIKEAKIDIGSHHTHVISSGDEIELTQEGGLSRVDSGLIVVENDEVLIFEVAVHGIRDVSQFNLRGGGKRIGDSTAVRNEFFEKVAKETKMVFPDEMPLILCGPGMAREGFEILLRRLGAQNKIVNAPTTIGGRSAANEVLAEGLADSLLGEHAIVEQVRAIEEGLKRVSTDGAVTYGMEMVSDAARQGAVETLVIEARLLRVEENHSDWESIAEAVESSSGKVIQASTEHDAGKQLQGMGGAIALLRWKLE
jgi:protein pelota